MEQRESYSQRHLSVQQADSQLDVKVGRREDERIVAIMRGQNMAVGWNAIGQLVRVVTGCCGDKELSSLRGVQGDDSNSKRKAGSHRGARQPNIVGANRAVRHPLVRGRVHRVIGARGDCVENIRERVSGKTRTMKKTLQAAKQTHERTSLRRVATHDPRPLR